MKPAERVLFEAIANGKVDIVAQMISADKELLSAVDDESEGVSNGDNPIHRACRVGNVDVLNGILAVSMAEKDRPKIVNGIPAPSPLMIAVSKQHTSVVIRLIEVSANVNYINQKDFGYTALFFAISAAGKPGNPMIVQALINAGADITYKANNGGDPITYAQVKGTSEILSILKKAHQANIDKMKAKLAELEKQQEEARNRYAELETRNKVLQTEISGAKAQYAQDQVKLNLEFAQYSLDVYKSAVVDGNKGPLPKFVPSSVTASKTNQAYTDAQKRQAQAGTPDQPATPGMKPG